MPLDKILLERDAYMDLLEWKKTNGSRAILIDGARRVGKSHLAETFAKNEYRSYVLIDFSRASPSLKSVFENDMSDLDMFFEKIKVITGVRELYERDSVLVFDEVQEFPRAREMIKHLVADGRYDYIETGSLLSIEANIRNIVIPSEERRLRLYPLSFKEFLKATGKENMISLMRDCFEELKPLGQAVHHTIMNEFRRYMMVGGMPQAVLKYMETGSFSEVDSVKREILDLYRSDVTKYANGQKARVKSLFDRIPAELSRKKKTFSITSLGKNARSRDYDDAFMWLEDGRIINQCFNSTDPSYGLFMSLDHTKHKCYMGDTGLLVTHSISVNAVTSEDVYRSIIADRMNINEGMFMENIVAQELRSNGHNLFFYSRNDPDNRENTMEIDFLIARDAKICLVEVKSSSKISHSSLDKFCRKFKGRIGQPYLLCLKDISVEDGYIRLPVYMAGLL